jgi:hypothetical protein
MGETLSKFVINLCYLPSHLFLEMHLIVGRVMR